MTFIVQKIETGAERKSIKGLRSVLRPDESQRDGFCSCSWRWQYISAKCRVRFPGLLQTQIMLLINVIESNDSLEHSERANRGDPDVTDPNRREMTLPSRNKRLVVAMSPL